MAGTKEKWFLFSRRVINAVVPLAVVGAGIYRGDQNVTPEQAQAATEALIQNGALIFGSVMGLWSLFKPDGATLTALPQPKP